MSSTTPPKTLVLLFDGTGKFFKKQNTNVVRLFAALEHEQPDKQMLYYQPGVGTYIAPGTTFAGGFRSLAKVLDKAFAWYLSNHIVRGYRFLMQNYREGDRICLFGFSRGAYTARALAGMLHKVGLLPAGNEEQLPFAWKTYKDGSKAGIAHAKEFKKTFSRRVEIAFVGVWDTVSSVGLSGVHLAYTRLNTSIRTIRHALALDERRTRFKPNPCVDDGVPLTNLEDQDTLGATTESNTAALEVLAQQRLSDSAVPPTWSSPGPSRKALGKIPEGRQMDISLQTMPPRSHQGSPELRQHGMPPEYAGAEEPRKGRHVRSLEVWFAGCHSDVGGGTANSESEDGGNLANISFGWMVKEAIKAPKVGLLFRPEAFESLPGGLYDILPHLPTDEDRTARTPDAAPPNRIKTPISRLEELLGRLDVSETSPGQQANQPPENRTNLPVDSPGHDRTVEVDDTVAMTLEQLKMNKYVKDSLAEIHDHLNGLSVWWLVEWIPCWDNRANQHGIFERGFSWNRGKGRVIPSEDIHLHSSVLIRQRLDKSYKHRAKLEGNVVYVD